MLQLYQWCDYYSALVIFFIAKTKYLALKVKGRKVYFISKFVKVSVPNSLAP